MKKIILASLVGGTVGTLIVGIIAGQWLMGAAVCYAISFIISVINFFIYKNNKD